MAFSKFCCLISSAVNFISVRLWSENISYYCNGLFVQYVPQVVIACAIRLFATLLVFNFNSWPVLFYGVLEFILTVNRLYLLNSLVVFFFVLYKPLLQLIKCLFVNACTLHFSFNQLIDSCPQYGKEAEHYKNN